MYVCVCVVCVREREREREREEGIVNLCICVYFDISFD